MLTVYRGVKNDLRIASLDESLKGTWIQLVDPTANEIEQVAATANIPENFIRFAAEEDACPRIIRANRCILVIINVPVARGGDQYDTMPLSIILTPQLSVTVCSEWTPVLPNGSNGAAVFDTGERTRFLFQILYQTSTVFLKHIYKIRQRTDEIEVELRKSTDNQEVFMLLDLEKGLTYFTAALRSNIIVIETVFRMRTDPQLQELLHMYREDEDILENAIIENKRALATVETYSEILSSMMDAFSSVIANNLNHMMKFLASITILVSVPTMVSSFWSMSLVVPWQGTAAGFWIVVVLSLVASGLVGYVLWKRRMF